MKTANDEIRDLGALEEVAEKLMLKPPAGLDDGWRAKEQRGELWWERELGGGVVRKHWIRTRTRTASVGLLERGDVFESVSSWPEPTPVADVHRVALSLRALPTLEVGALHVRNLRVETGGVLYGRSENGVFRVERAVSASENETASSMDVAARGETLQPKDGFPLRGCWHCHPRGGPLPSNIDKNAWAKSFRWNRQRGSTEPWVSLIVDSKDVWTTGLNDVAAYITDENGTRSVPIVPID